MGNTSQGFDVLEIVEATYTSTSSWPPSPAPVRGSNDPFLPALPMATDLCALARHATGTGNGTLIHTVHLIRHQQVRGSSPRVGSNIARGYGLTTPRHKPTCHHDVTRSPEPNRALFRLPCVPTATPAHAAPMR